jgi:hypothetical protein
MIAICFLPYLIVYLVGWALGFAVSWLLAVFWVLHFCLAALGAHGLWSRGRSSRREIPWEDVLFWGGLFIAFLLPGTYLEYPSDAWAHFFRLTSWDTTAFISQANTPWKFAYFWGWSFLTWVPMEEKVRALGFYAAFWQWLLAIQVYRWMRGLGQGRAEAWLQVIGFFGLCGTNVFNFRYYALSSTPLAYIAYIEAFLAFSSWLGRHQRKEVLRIGAMLPLMGFNHPQALLYFGLSGAVLLFVSLHEGWDRKRRRQVYVAGVGLGLASVLSGVIWVHYFPWWYDHVGVGNVTFFGSLKIWSLGSSHWETFGIHGALALIVAVLTIRRDLRLSLLTLASTAFVLFPPSAAIFARLVVDFYITYRAHFAFPLSVILVHYGYQAGARFIGPPAAECPPSRRRSSALAWGIGAALLVVVSIPPYPPYRGRMFFQFYQPDPALELRPQLETALWLRDHRKSLAGAQLFTDPMTGEALKAYLGQDRWVRNFGYDRLEGSDFVSLEHEELDSVEKMRRTFRRAGINAILVPDWSLVPPAVPSRIAALSGHWNDGLTNLRVLVTDRLTRNCEQLAAADGWSRTRVPPYYWLYEAPP